MSAYGIGADAAAVDKNAADAGKKRIGSQDDPNNKSNIPETLVKWIPGEALAFYTGILALGAAQPVLAEDASELDKLQHIDPSSFGWFAAGILVAVGLVFVGAFTTSKRKDGTTPSRLSLLWRSILATVAFILGTSVIPGSWVYELHFVRDLGPGGPLLLVPVGLIFAGIAEGTTRTKKI